MDRGIPTEEVLGEMRSSGRVNYVVGTPKGRLGELEPVLWPGPGRAPVASVRVKLLAQDKETYVYVQSEARIGKERSMRRRRLKRLWSRLHELQTAAARLRSVDRQDRRRAPRGWPNAAWSG